MRTAWNECRDLCVAVAFAALLSAAAQQKTPAPPLSTNVETLHFVALGEHGSPVTDMRAEELQLSIDNQRQKIDSVKFMASAPLTIIFLFDISGSRREDAKRRQEVEAFRNFVDRIWQPGDAAWVVTFNEDFYVENRDAQDRAEIDRALVSRALEEPRGSTALYDALYGVQPSKTPARSRRKLVFVLSDFEDNSSKHNLAAAVERLWEAETPVYSLILPPISGPTRNSDETRGFRVARELSRQTGGEVYVPGSAKELASILEWLSAHVRGFYALEYTSSALATPAARSRKKFVSVDLQTTRSGVILLFPKGRYVPKR